MADSTNSLRKRVSSARRELFERLLAQRNEWGHWTGELSTSALSTATATLALWLVDTARVGSSSASLSHNELVHGGLRWLVEHVNSDGGWGDTTRSHSNLSTTTLCWATLQAARGTNRQYQSAIDRAEDWIRRRTTSLDPAKLAEAVTAVYGKDRTFSVPILTHCSLAGCLGPTPACWGYVRSLPFELAALPRSWFKNVGLPVVSYALPALIAVGQVRHHHLPSRNPFARLLRRLTRQRTLDLMNEIQPTSGGFLEAIPLTSFVTMSLAGSDQVEHPATLAGVRFLESSVLSDGSWPIDSNLATWVTTLAVNAIAGTPENTADFDQTTRAQIRDWLLRQQYQEVHPYTHASPGGWAWTDLPGGVPDADDTPGALLALRHLAAGPEIDPTVRDAAEAGLGWLLDLQNRDGGMPTFCRGWGRLPFDRSGADLTSHALKAWHAWSNDLPRLSSRIDRAIKRGVEFLRRSQRSDGSWTPLWFGCQHAPQSENPVYGTARVVDALHTVAHDGSHSTFDAIHHAHAFLLSAQNDDGGWGGAPQTPSSIEETALALTGLVSAPADERRANEAMERGCNWLLRQIESGQIEHPTPIGFYFAKLWYYEKLYPFIFALEALGRVGRRLDVPGSDSTRVSHH